MLCTLQRYKAEALWSRLEPNCQNPQTKPLGRRIKKYIHTLHQCLNHRSIERPASSRQSKLSKNYHRDPKNVNFLFLKVLCKINNLISLGRHLKNSVTLYKHSSNRTNLVFPFKEKLVIPSFVLIFLDRFFFYIISVTLSILLSFISAKSLGAYHRLAVV